jgi:hypothetical protein
MHLHSQHTQKEGETSDFSDEEYRATDASPCQDLQAIDASPYQEPQATDALPYQEPQATDFSPYQEPLTNSPDNKNTGERTAGFNHKSQPDARRAVKRSRLKVAEQRPKAFAIRTSACGFLVLHWVLSRFLVETRARFDCLLSLGIYETLMYP